MKKLVFIFSFITFFNYAQVKSEFYFEKNSQKGIIKVDFLSVKMPEDETNLGLSGIHYNLSLNNWSYVGLGMYGAVTGIRGGFFTLGVNAGIRKELFPHFYLDAGGQFGGGGGSGAPDGGGAYILPHLNLGYAFNHFSIETGYSYINFFDNGNINSSQLNFALIFPISYNYSSFKYLEKEIDINELIKKSEWYNESNKISILVHFNNLDLIGKTKDDTGTDISDKMINTVGVELNSYFSKNTFLFLKVDGAYNGIPAGFMDVILGLGYQLSFNKNRTKILGKFGIGAAGGGSVDIQGGFILYPDISIEQKLYSNLFISLNKGFLFTPNTYFMSSTYGIGFKYYTDMNGLKTEEKNNYTKAIFKGKEVIVAQEIYLDAARNNAEPQNMQQILLQLNFFLNKNLYLSGQTSFANFGNAGAYAEGLAGLGLSTSNGFSNNFQVFSQFLIGAAGGGFIYTGQGLIIKPSIGISYFFNDKIGLRTSAGLSKAIDGELNSSFLNFGINYRISTLKLK